MNRVKTATALILLVLGSAAMGGEALARGFGGQGFHSSGSFRSGGTVQSGGGFHGGGGFRSHGGFNGGGDFHSGGGHGHVGVYIGVPVILGPDFYYSPHNYYPPDDTDAYLPPVAVDNGDSTAAPAPQTHYWYYCSNPRGYYPYVQQCPGGWQLVSPQPPPPATTGG